MTPQERLFIGVFPTGFSYCDKSQEKDGDYLQLAFLPFDTLELLWRVPVDTVDLDLRGLIVKDWSDHVAKQRSETRN